MSNNDQFNNVLPVKRAFDGHIQQHDPKRRHIEQYEIKNDDSFNMPNIPNAPIVQPELSIVAQHAMFFAVNDTENVGGILTSESIINGHTQQDIPHNLTLAGKTKAIMNMAQAYKLGNTACAFARLENPARTGLWNSQGDFDEKQYDVLCDYASAYDYAITHDGKRVITEKIMNNFRGVIHGNKNDGKVAVFVSILPITWNRVTNGSINELFTYYYDCKVLEDGANVHALTLYKIKEFYTKPQQSMRLRKLKLSIAKKLI